MSNVFYDPMIETATAIAEQYGISISDVLTLLLQAGKDEALVRRLLDQSAQSGEARAAQNEGRQFDLVEYARALLKSSK
jgi:antitoxin component of RelBE/YafQ-DinJ toxin-antitoxin module